MLSQQAFRPFSKIAMERQLMTRGGYLFHGSAILTKKVLFFEPNRVIDGAISGLDHEDENKSAE